MRSPRTLHRRIFDPRFEEPIEVVMARRLSADAGSAREVDACMEIAIALTYVAEMPSEMRGRVDHVIGTLVNLTRR